MSDGTTKAINVLENMARLSKISLPFGDGHLQKAFTAAADACSVHVQNPWR